MIIPPAALAPNPTSDTPPFVPGGTFFQGFVTNLGRVFESIPSSDAYVSPAQHAKKATYAKVSWSPKSANEDDGIATVDLPKSKGPSLPTIILLVQAKITPMSEHAKT